VSEPQSLVLTVAFDDDVPILQSALLDLEVARTRVPPGSR
jgi:hypothetical protein